MHSNYPFASVGTWKPHMTWKDQEVNCSGLQVPSVWEEQEQRKPVLSICFHGYQVHTVTLQGNPIGPVLVHIWLVDAVLGNVVLATVESCSARSLYISVAVTGAPCFTILMHVRFSFSPAELLLVRTWPQVCFTEGLVRQLSHRNWRLIFVLILTVYLQWPTTAKSYANFLLSIPITSPWMHKEGLIPLH